jgi:hypothetical protein
MAFLLPLAAPLCAVTHPATCETTNALVHDAGFRSAVRRFVGKRRADYLYPNGSVADQMIDVLGGPAGSPDRLGSNYLFTACRAHSCGEKGAAVLASDGAIVALAILHGACAKTPSPDHCYAHDTLTIFARRETPAAVEKALGSWARRAIAETPATTSLQPTTLDRIETIDVGG